MAQLHTNNADVQKVWGWCQAAFAANGRALSFPKNTDASKTYQWRYVSKLSAQFEEWEFDDQTAKAFINIAVSYARKNNLLRKGLSAMFQKNMLQICYDHMEGHNTLSESRVDGLVSSMKFVSNRRSGRSYLDTLLDSKRGGHANIVEWYDTNKITLHYLALSKSCTIALLRLKKKNPRQRELLPSAGELWCVKSEVSDDLDLKRKSTFVLGNDWRK